MAIDTLTHQINTAPIIDKIEVEKAYQFCETIARQHYENFPVASFFLPKKIRRAITVIYAFARKADDISDEGLLSSEERLSQLGEYWGSLKAVTTVIEETKKTQKNETMISPIHNPIFIALQDILTQYPDLPTELFFDLLCAFKQDVIKNTYENFDEILNYCYYSARPIGQLLLYLTNNATPENLKNSDDICYALQLINFLQDLDSDLHDRNRCYLPQDEMQKCSITIDMLKQHKNTPEIQNLIRNQLIKAEEMLIKGSVLGSHLKGLFGLEIRFIVQGGIAIVKKLKERQTPYIRPTLKHWHMIPLFWRAL